jgi:hypothetical protein
MPTHTKKNGALRALLPLTFKIETSQYFLFPLFACVIAQLVRHIQAGPRFTRGPL